MQNMESAVVMGQGSQPGSAWHHRMQCYSAGSLGAARHIVLDSAASCSISCVQVQAVRPQADWYLFGGAECQIGKTFACVVGAVACQEWHLICICLTYTASVHVKDLRDKMTSYLRVPTMTVDPTGNTVYSDNLT